MKPAQQVISILTLLICCWISTPAYSQLYNTTIQAKLDLESNADFVSLRASAINKTVLDQTAQYMLSVIKNDPNAEKPDKKDQKGWFTLAGDEQKSVDVATVSRSETNRIIVLLLIYNEQDKLIGKDRIVLNPTRADREMAARTGEQVFDIETAKGQENEENSYEKVLNTEEDFYLRGIITEDTKTKPGRDFYALYAAQYRQDGINGELIVTIKETLSIANNTKIEVIVGDTKVLEFIVRPQADFLKQAKDVAIQRTKKYFQDFRSGKLTIRHY